MFTMFALKYQKILLIYNVLGFVLFQLCPFNGVGICNSTDSCRAGDANVIVAAPCLKIDSVCVVALVLCVLS